MAKQQNLFFWRLSEFAFKVIAGVKPIGSEPNLFLIAHRRYLGRPFTVDGVKVRRFDKVLEIHMNNELVLETLHQHDTLVATTVNLLKEARKSLPVLAQYAKTHSGDSVQVLYGITFINRGIERLGFSVLPIYNNFFREYTRQHLQGLFRKLNPNANQFLEEHEDLYVPMVVAISKQNLLQRYDKA